MMMRVNFRMTYVRGMPAPAPAETIGQKRWACIKNTVAWGMVSGLCASAGAIVPNNSLEASQFKLGAQIVALVIMGLTVYLNAKRYVAISESNSPNGIADHRTQLKRTRMGLAMVGFIPAALIVCGMCSMATKDKNYLKHNKFEPLPDVVKLLKAQPRAARLNY